MARHYDANGEQVYAEDVLSEEELTEYYQQIGGRPWEGRER